LADPLYLGHYPLVVVGLVLLIRRRNPGRDLANLLDAATLAVAAAMLSWLYLIAPQARADSPMLVKLVSCAYPVMDLLMFAPALRLILGQGRRPASFLLLAGNLLAIFTADTIYVTQQLNGTYQTGNFLDAIWLCGNLALGAAALHPTVGRVADRAAVQDVLLTRSRLAVLAGAALIAPATLVLQDLFGTLHDVPVIAGACAILSCSRSPGSPGWSPTKRRLAITDVLTGLRTRRFFSAQAADRDRQGEPDRHEPRGAHRGRRPVQVDQRPVRASGRGPGADRGGAATAGIRAAGRLPGPLRR